MKVYVITSGSYSDYSIEAVSVDKDEAERICATLNTKRKYDFDDWCSIEEYDTDEMKVESENEVKIRYEMEVKYTDGKILYFDNHGYFVFNDINTIKVTRRYENKRIEIVATFSKDTDPDKAKKIMLYRVAKFKAEREGVV